VKSDLRERLDRRVLVLAVVVLLGAFAAGCAGAAGRRDVLWEIVSTCLAPGGQAGGAPCRWPREDAAGAAGRTCTETTQVWAEAEAYVVIRDIKMCGCPMGFVHGLAMPRARVTGVEDPRRPDGIWGFAWAAARERIADETAIALVVNPARGRSQDHLHVHLVRLRDDARRRLAGRTVRVERLAEVWSAAAGAARAAQLDDYGVLVARPLAGDGFLVLVESDSPERAYTQESCR
jgi:CDP-diacylglycerol pyrophosphatase